MDDQLAYILDRVTRHDDERGPYKAAVQQWQKMWRLDPGFVEPLSQAILKGQEQVITPTPFNVVNLSQRLLSTTPRVDVIPQDIANQESVQYAESCEKWLTAMWKRINFDQRKNVLSDAIIDNLVCGRFAFEVKWIKQNLPPMLKKTVFPILIRTLDPVNVGLSMGPYAPEFAYHKYTDTARNVIRRWPDLKEAEAGSVLRGILDNMERNDQRTEDQEVCVIDYWAMDPESGSIYNAVLVEDEYALPYKQTKYPYIPIIVGKGDYAPHMGDAFDGLSILHTLNGLWQYDCRLKSQMATGLLWYFWPEFLVSNENNLPVDDIEIGPGRTEPVPYGTKVEQVTMNPNVPLAEAVNTFVEGAIQQSTYPEVMYGQAPGDLQAGYGVSLLSDAAKGRIKNFQESLEMAISHVNSLVLCLVEKFGGAAGVDIYGVDTRDDAKYRLNLNKTMIQGNYQNEVRITPAIPQDDANRAVIGKQFADGKYISAETLRDQYLSVKAPTNETQRLAFEEAMQSDELRTFRLQQAVLKYYGDGPGMAVLFGTPLMPTPPEGYEWTKDPNGNVTLKKSAPQQPTPGALPPGPPNGAGQPPMPMPPTNSGGALGQPPLGTPPIQPPATLAGPTGGGFPPIMNGQFDPETLGQPQGMPPGQFDMLMNTPGSGQQQMNLAAGMNPDGLPYG